MRAKKTQYMYLGVVSSESIFLSRVKIYIEIITKITKWYKMCSKKQGRGSKFSTQSA